MEDFNNRTELEDIFGMNDEDKMARIMAKGISAEIDKEILRDISVMIPNKIAEQLVSVQPINQSVFDAQKHIAESRDINEELDWFSSIERWEEHIDPEPQKSKNDNECIIYIADEKDPEKIRL